MVNRSLVDGVGTPVPQDARVCLPPDTTKAGNRHAAASGGYNSFQHFRRARRDEQRGHGRTLTYQELAKQYANYNRQSKAPMGFKLHCLKKGGVADPNTYAVRLAYAIFLCDRTFFEDVEAK